MAETNVTQQKAETNAVAFLIGRYGDDKYELREVSGGKNRPFRFEYSQKSIGVRRIVFVDHKTGEVSE